jgi:flagellar biosynthesis/type III secretory pathway protein FliH
MLHLSIAGLNPVGYQEGFQEGFQERFQEGFQEGYPVTSQE